MKKTIEVAAFLVLLLPICLSVIACDKKMSESEGSGAAAHQIVVVEKAKVFEPVEIAFSDPSALKSVVWSLSDANGNDLSEAWRTRQ